MSEEGTDSKNHFAPVARLEAVLIFVAYAAHKPFWKTNVLSAEGKSVFLSLLLFGALFQPLGEEDLLSFWLSSVEILPGKENVLVVRDWI
ncbi:hypothetical protein Tco_0162949 [Tanacetum coccineum]